MFLVRYMLDTFNTLIYTNSKLDGKVCTSILYNVTSYYAYTQWVHGKSYVHG